LEPDDFGRINLAQTIGLYVALLTDGMKLYGVREIAQNRHRAQAVVDENLQHILSVSFLEFVVCVAVLSILPISLDFKLLLVAFVLSSLIMAAFFTDWIYQGHEVMRIVALGNLGRYIFYVLLVIPLLAADANIRWVGAASLGGAILAAVVMVKKLHLIGIRIKLGVDIKGALRLDRLKTPFILGLTSLRNQLFYTPVTVILSLHALHAEVGIFNAAFKLAFFIGSLGNVFIQSIFPRISSHCANDPEALQILLDKSMRLLNFFLIPIGFGGVFLAERLVVLIFGEQYLASSFLFGVVLWAVIIMLLSYNYSSVLIGHDRQDIFIFVLLTALSINIFANIIAIYYYKAIGAAFVALSSEAIVLFALSRYCKKLFGININNHIIIPTAGSVFMITVLYIIAIDNLIPNIVLGAGAYIFFLRFLARINIIDIIKVDSTTV